MGITHLIASKINEENSVCESENCYGEEKVRRFKLVYGDTMIEQFYSDSKSDEPMVNIAKVSYLVKKNRVEKWQL